MFGNAYTAAFVRFVLLVLLQTQVLSRVGLEEAWGPYVQALVYPLVIFLLPVGMPLVLVLLIAFAVGFSVDVLNASYGMHAAALVFTAFVRNLVLVLLEPREGYAVGQSANAVTFGWRWFAMYSAILMVIHCIAYFSIEVFTFVFLGKILLQAIGSFCVSMLLILLYTLVFSPRN